jgi:hypothetical protein
MADPPTVVMDRDASASPFCGDGVVQATRGEQCDGADLGGHSCTEIGLAGGQLGCNPMTCQLIIAQCIQTGASAPVPDSGTRDAGFDSGVVDAGSTAQPCPNGFLCLVSGSMGGEHTCAQWGEETPPICLNPGGDATCAMVLPGSACTDTSLGSYCLRSCTP